MSQSKIMLGNAAIAQGAYEAGVKAQEADGTMLETAWESRWLPD